MSLLHDASLLLFLVLLLGFAAPWLDLIRFAVDVHSSV